MYYENKKKLINIRNDKEKRESPSDHSDMKKKLNQNLDKKQKRDGYKKSSTES